MEREKVGAGQGGWTISIGVGRQGLMVYARAEL